MALGVAPQRSGMFNRGEIQHWEAYVHGGTTIGQYSTKKKAVKAAKNYRDKHFDKDTQIKVVNANGGHKWV